MAKTYYAYTVEMRRKDSVVRFRSLAFSEHDVYEMKAARDVLFFIQVHRRDGYSVSSRKRITIPCPEFADTECDAKRGG